MHPSIFGNPLLANVPSNFRPPVASLFASLLFLALTGNWRVAGLIFANTLITSISRHLNYQKHGEDHPRLSDYLLWPMQTNWRRGDDAICASSILAAPLIFWGIFFFVATATENRVLQAGVMLMLMLNLLNSLPICPFDGGVISRSVFFSHSTVGGKISVAISFIVSAIISGMNFLLLFLVGAANGVVTATEAARTDKAPMGRLEMIGFATLHLGIFTAYIAMFNTLRLKFPDMEEFRALIQ